MEPALVGHFMSFMGTCSWIKVNFLHKLSLRHISPPSAFQHQTSTGSRVMWLQKCPSAYSSRSSSGSSTTNPRRELARPRVCWQHKAGVLGLTHLRNRPRPPHASSSSVDPPAAATPNSTAGNGPFPQPGPAPTAADAADAAAAGAAATSTADTADATQLITTAAADASSTTNQPSLTETGQEASDTVSQARLELDDAWQQLKDAAAMAFVPGYRQQREKEAATAVRRQPLRYSGLMQTTNTSNSNSSSNSSSSSSSSSTQQQEAGAQGAGSIESIPDRLTKLLSGQFIRERDAALGQGASPIQQQQQQQQQVDMRFAAMQFEMLRGSKQQQQQQQGNSEASTAAAAAGTATIGPDGIIDVVPEGPSSSSSTDASAGAGATPATAASPSGTSTPPAVSTPTADPAAAVPEVEAEVVSDGEVPTPTGFYPASTQVLVMLTWGVFVVQWAQALPELLEMLSEGGLLTAAASVLLASPDTPLTRSLWLDLSALQQGHGWWGLITSGLCHSGLAAVWLCTAALQNCGRWLEAGTGQLQLLTVFLICSLCASLAHMFAGGCRMCMAGPGAILGVYTTWAVLATQYMRQVVPLRTIYGQGLLLLVLVLALGALQPAVSWASVFGGILGGVVAVAVAGPVSRALRQCLALPVMGGLLLLKLFLDLLLVIYYSIVFVAAGAWQVLKDTVVTVRRL